MRRAFGEGERLDVQPRAHLATGQVAQLGAPGLMARILGLAPDAPMEGLGLRLSDRLSASQRRALGRGGAGRHRRWPAVRGPARGLRLSEVAFAVVVLSDPASKWHEIDTTRAVQNMVLTAWSFKLGSCWIGRLDTKGLKNYLEIPEKWNVLTVLPFGYFNEKIMTTSKFRKAPVDIFHLNAYGNKIIE